MRLAKVAIAKFHISSRDYKKKRKVFHKEQLEHWTKNFINQKVINHYNNRFILRFLGKKDLLIIAMI